VAYATLDPPSGAVRETEATVRDDLERGGGAIAWFGDHAIGCLRFEREPDYLHVRRVAVDPPWQRQGIGKALMEWAHDFARKEGYRQVRVGVRLKLRENVRFYEQLGYRRVAEHRHPGYRNVTWIEMAREV
jgi:tRNA threonylcarbamoyladenosine biosynthesis protein TsaE